VTSMLRWIPPVVSACAAAVLTSGCATIGAIAVDAAYIAYIAAFRTKFEDASRLSADELRQVRSVQLYDTVEGLDYASTGHVAGYACKMGSRWIPDLSALDGSTPREVATTQVRIRAFKSGANVVLSLYCLHKKSMDWASGCDELWMCDGEAIRLKE
jgi:hypothetical protein